MYDATNESPEGGNNYPKIGVTPEFMQSFRGLKNFLVIKYGKDAANAKLKQLAKHFQETMDDHQFVDKMISANFGLGDLLQDANFKS